MFRNPIRAKGIAERQVAVAALTRSFLVDPLDDRFDLGLFDPDVRDLEPVDDLLDGRGRRRRPAVDVQAVAVQADLARLEVPERQLPGIRSVLDVEDDGGDREDPVAQLVERAVEEEARRGR